MKKLLLSVAALCCAGVASAEVITTTYYGVKAVKDDVNPCRGATTHICAQIITRYGFDGQPTLEPDSVDAAHSSVSVTKIIRIPSDASAADRATLMSLANPAKGIFVVMGTEKVKD